MVSPDPVSAAPDGPAAGQSRIAFDFYGVRVEVACDDAEILDRVEHDFYYFREETPNGATPELRLTLHRRDPDYTSLPALPASVYTPRNISFTQGDVSYFDYFGRALGVYDRERQAVDVTGSDLSLLHEIAYLSILSRVAGALERRGFHRMHALSVGRVGKAALFMMPSGCGKTTLGMALMAGGAGFELISDDSPLISRTGKVLPFPLRFGVLGQPPEGVPDRYIRYLERMEFAPKYLISMQAYDDAVARGEWDPAVIFLGDRNLGQSCEIRPVGFLAGFRAAIRHMIVGIGLYQGLEFMLRSSLADLFRSSGVGLSRSWAAARVLRSARVYHLSLGRNPALNARVIEDFLDGQLPRPTEDVA